VGSSCFLSLPALLNPPQGDPAKREFNRVNVENL